MDAEYRDIMRRDYVALNKTTGSTNDNGAYTQSTLTDGTVKDGR
jgi:hypothetical protein